VPDEAPFDNRVVAITGAGSGLGRAMAMEFAGAGACVAVMDIDAAAAAETAGAISEAGGEATHLAVDVADAEALAAAAHEVAEHFGACHILCANVGVQQFGAIDRLTADDWRWVIDVNVLGTVNTVSAFLPLIRGCSGRRHILLTSSSGVHTPGVRLAAYTTSKFAVMGYGETLRLELAPEGIGVSVLFPAGMITRHLESSALARPVERGPSVMLPDDIDAMLASSDMAVDAHSVVAAEVAVRNLLAELATDPPYIVTHGSYRDGLARRHAELLEAYERGQQDLPD
jgi:NAD(P)-dependent dehydrogenase (short-subunit alcohol dehydrogenase family)